MKPISADAIDIRLMQESDFTVLEAILNEPEVQTYYPMKNPREVRDALQVWRHYMKQKAVFTAEVEGKPVGMVILYVNPYKKLCRQALFAIVIGREYRGRGIGTLLMNDLIYRAKHEFGIQLLHLEMYEGNPAFSLYNRLGFKVYGEHKRFLKEGNGIYKSKIMMQKHL